MTRTQDDPSGPTRDAAVAGPFVKPIPDDLFIRHDTNAETRWTALASCGELVPADRFFVRSAGATPVIDASGWRLRIEGDGVGRAVTLSYDDLKALPQTARVCALECAGNGRLLFADGHRRVPEGTPWRLGAVGVAEWGGVVLADVLAVAGVLESAVDVMPEGLDEDRVRRPLPVAKAMDGATLLALRMNGEPLPRDHGFPARVVVPGWAAIASTKWVGRITVSTTPQRSFWNTAQYVLNGPAYRPDPSQPGPMVTAQVPKSALELDWPARLAAGPIVLRGRAWSPAAAIQEVAVAVEREGGGRSDWLAASLVGANRPQAWARFELDWDASAGDYRIWVRATDTDGSTQPDEVPWNDHGYLYGAVAGHPVTVV